MSQLSGRTIFIAVGILAAIMFVFRTNKKEGFRKVDSKKSCPDLLVQKGTKIYLYNTNRAEVPGVNPIAFNNLEEYTEFLDWQKSQGIYCPVLYLQEVYDASGKMVCKVRPCTSEPQGGLPPASATNDAKGTLFNEQTNLNGVNSVSGMGTDGTSSNVQGTNASKSSKTSSLSTTSSSYQTDHNNRYPNLERVKLLDSNVNDPPYNIGGYPSYDPTSFYHGKHTPLDELDVQAEASEISPSAMDPNWGGHDYTKGLVEGGYYKDNEIHYY